jgi:DNA-binding response OmpR family regulator
MPKRILVVEDNDDLRQYFVDVLTIAGFDVEQAADGMQALRHLDNQTPDLVVLDLRMPMFTGLEIRQDLTANILTRNVPVVVVSGSPEDLRDIEVDCVLKKPVMPDVLVDTVRRCLESGPRRSRS